MSKYKTKKIHSLSGIIKQLKFHRSIHYEYINNPEYCNEYVGDKKFHVDVVANYTCMIRYLKKLYIIDGVR